MADLPALSESTKRKLAVEWESIRDNHELTDEHLAGYDLGRQWLWGTLAKPPHGMNLGGLNIGRTFEDRKRAAHWLGCDPSVRASLARFGGIDSEYWSHWGLSGCGYEVYRDWLNSITRQVLAEFASIWKGRSPVTDRWFEDTCAPAIEKALADRVKQRIKQARRVEINRLEQKARAEAWARAAEGDFPKAKQTGATEPSRDEATRAEAESAASGLGGSQLSWRDAFKEQLEF